MTPSTKISAPSKGSILHILSAVTGVLTDIKQLPVVATAVLALVVKFLPGVEVPSDVLLSAVAGVVVVDNLVLKIVNQVKEDVESA